MAMADHEADPLAGIARIDHDRPARAGVPEAVLCTGKQPADVAAIARSIVERDGELLCTRAEAAHWEAVRAVVPGAIWEERARCIVHRRREPLPPHGLVAVVSAGTGDIPVAEEARVTLSALGSHAEPFYDVGVAGIHRVMAHLDRLRAARAIVVAAGMEGALASVVAGLVTAPVVAVPTSIGYGASFGGLAALLGMLNSCAPGVAVVNIDNGYGAGVMAHMINAAGQATPRQEETATPS
jgi:NCAIR mutase (PurE)-related protein